MTLPFAVTPYQSLGLLQDATPYQCRFRKRKPTFREMPANLRSERKRAQKKSQRRQSLPDDARGVQSQSQQRRLSSHLCQPCP